MRTYSRQTPLVLMHVPLILIKNLICVFKCHTALVDNHQAFLNGVSRSLRRVVAISCGGRGDAADVLRFSELASCESWQSYFDGFQSLLFYGDQDYSLWLEKAGFNVERLELVPTDMTHPGKEGLAGWIRTTWMLFTQYVSESKRDNFITHFVETY